MNLKNDIELFLPKYLSVESTKILLKELESFPENIDERMYSSSLAQGCPDLLQGDGIKEMLVINLPDIKIEPKECMILSNSCHIDPQNERKLEARVCYAPIIKLSAYKNLLIKKWSTDIKEIENHISELVKQSVLNIFFLPKGVGLQEDSFIFLDRICNCPNSAVNRNELKKLRLFSLSDYGFYLFVFKLAVHFTRITEQLDRGQA